MSYDEINLDSKAVEKLQEVVGGGGQLDFYLLDMEGGQVENDDYMRVLNGQAFFILYNETTDNDTMLIQNGGIAEPYQTIFSSLLQDGKYYNVIFEDDGTSSPKTYTVTEVSAGVEFVEIDQDATSINQETLEKLVDFNNGTLKPNFIVLTTESETDTFPILMPSDNLQYIYRSAVMGDKYYQLTLSINEVGADVSIEQVQVGGGSGLDIIILEEGSGTLTDEQVTRLLDGAWFDYFGCILMPSGERVEMTEEGPIGYKYFSSTIGMSMTLGSSTPNAFYRLVFNDVNNTYAIEQYQVTVTQPE